MELVIVKMVGKENIVRQKTVLLSAAIMANAYKMEHVNGIKFFISYKCIKFLKNLSFEGFIGQYCEKLQIYNSKL